MAEMRHRGFCTLCRSRCGAIFVTRDGLLKEVLPDDELMLITKHGVVIRMPVKGIRVSGRNTQGVKLVNLDEGDRVCDVARVVIEDDEQGGGDEGEEPVTLAPEEEE